MKRHNNKALHTSLFSDTKLCVEMFQSAVEKYDEAVSDTKLLLISAAAVCSSGTGKTEFYAIQNRVMQNCVLGLQGVLRLFCNTISAA
jgi:hypothetical protein